LLRRLRRRHAARYCGRDCQEAAWAAHKKTCTYTSLCHFAVLRTCAGELDGAVTLLKKATKAARALLGADSLPAAFLELKQAELLFHPQQPGSGAARVPLWLAGAELWRAALPTLERRRAAGTLLPGAVAPAESVFLERQRLSMLEGGAWTADASRLSYIDGVRAAPTAPTADQAASTAAQGRGIGLACYANAAYTALIFLNPAFFGVPFPALSVADRDAAQACVLTALSLIGASLGFEAPVLPLLGEEAQLCTALQHVTRGTGGVDGAFREALRRAYASESVAGALRARGLDARVLRLL